MLILKMNINKFKENLEEIAPLDNFYNVNIICP